MILLKRGIPVVIAIAAGLATLLGLLVVPVLGEVLLGWAAFLAAVALILGIFNLLGVHLKRVSKGNFFSLILVASMLIVFGLAITDRLEVTENGVDSVFTYVQVPLSAALASLLAFFFLFAGARLLQRQRNGWSVLFLLTAVLVLLSQSPLPAAIRDIVSPIYAFVSEILVLAGMRGLLLGIGLGTITLSLRLLAGVERPYSS